MPTLGNVLAGLAHRLERKLLLQARIWKAPAQLRVVLGAVAVFGFRPHERRPAHRLDSARDEEPSVARRNGVTRRHDRTQSRRAQTVHGDAGDCFRQPGKEHRHACDVAIVLTRLIRRAEVHVLDLLGAHARTLHRFRDHHGREIVRTDACERAATAPDRRAHA